MKQVIHTKNEPEVVSRIIDLLIQQGKTQTELLNYLGLHPNNFTEWKSRRKRSYLLYIDEIARYLDVSPTYLLRGEVEPTVPSKTDTAAELMDIYRQLNLEQQERLIAVARSIKSERSTEI